MRGGKQGIRNIILLGSTYFLMLGTSQSGKEMRQRLNSLERLMPFRPRTLVHKCPLYINSFS